MAEDPRKEFDQSQRRRPRRLEEASSEEIRFPLAWIIIGGLASLLVIGLVGLGVVNLVRQNAITPTPQILPPLAQILDTPTPLPTPTTQATATPVETLQPTDTVTDTGSAPQILSGPIEINGYVRVIDTGGVGLSMRAGPGRNNARVGVAEESDDIRLLVLDGPREDENAEDYIWWFIRHPDGTEGWIVEDFVAPVAGP